jgi:hypothetical protein
MESGGLDWQTLPLQYRELQVFLRVLKDVEVRQDDVRCLYTLPPRVDITGSSISLRHFTRRDFELCALYEIRENLISKALDQLFFHCFISYLIPSLQIPYVDDSSISIIFGEQVDHHGGVLFLLFFGVKPHMFRL